MTDKEIVDMAKDAEKRTGFGELVHSPISKGVNSAYGIGFIEGMVEYRNSLQEEHVSDDLEEAANKYGTKKHPMTKIGANESAYDFKSGAQWQAEQFEKNRLKHCDALTEEQAQIESDFVTRHLKENDRTPTFIDAIEYGMRLQKEKITKDVGDDLPIWRKRNDFEYPTQFCGVLITGGDTTTLPVFVADGYEIPIKDLLEKLPKED